jgi:hypothetical protein
MLPVHEEQRSWVLSNYKIFSDENKAVIRSAIVYQDTNYSNHKSFI